MSVLKWIVCENRGCWTAALRVALTRGLQSEPPDRICEVRTLGDLESALAQTAGCVVLIEVAAAGFEQTLSWIADAARQRRSPIIALVDRELTDRADVVAALWEAGVADISRSPRHLEPALAVGRAFRKFCSHTSEHPAQTSETFDAWAWSVLPWQDAERPLG